MNAGTQLTGHLRPGAQAKYENFHSWTCEHPEQGTLCIAVALHSPAPRLVKVDVTQVEQLTTGAEGASSLDGRKAPKHVKMSKRAQEMQRKQTLQCDVWCGYSEESGNARFDQTFQRAALSPTTSWAT